MEKIFSGEDSRELWDDINSIDNMMTGDQMHDVLYHICCKLQELETKYDNRLEVINDVLFKLMD